MTYTQTGASGDTPGDTPGETPGESMHPVDFCISEDLQRLLRIIGSAVPVRLVGGCVRDALLGVQPKDYDLASSLPPDQAIELLSRHGYRTVPTGIDHGTITVLTDRSSYELTTLRRDVATDGRRATVAWSRSFAEDAIRRDLTINALSVSFSPSGQAFVHDSTGGLDDIRTRTVRFVGRAKTRILEDRLRMLRFLRFHATIADARACPAGIDAISSMAGQVGTLSAERIRSELVRGLCGQPALTFSASLADTGLAAALGFSAGYAAYAGYVGHRCADPIAAIVAFDGRHNQGRFPPERIKQTARRLRLTKDETRRACWLTSRASMKITSHEAVEDAIADGVERSWIRSAVTLNGLPSLIPHVETVHVPAFPVTGQMLLDAGMAQGPELGERLRDMNRHWKNSRFCADADQLISMLGFTPPTAQLSGLGETRSAGGARSRS